MIFEDDGLSGDVLRGVHSRLESNFSGIISASPIVNSNALLKLNIDELKDKFTYLLMLGS